MLSKPNAESSAGSSDRTSTSSASRSRMTLPYSARLRRRSSGRPGFGTTAARSSSAVSHDVSDATVASSGRGIPCGGIARVRTLRVTASQIAGCASTWARSSVSSVSPPVPGPLVVAGHAVPIEDRARRCGVCRLQACRRRRAAHDGRQTQTRRKQNQQASHGWRGAVGTGTIVAGSGQLPSYGGQFGTASSAGG